MLTLYNLAIIFCHVVAVFMVNVTNIPWKSLFSFVITPNVEYMAERLIWKLSVGICFASYT